MPLAIDIVLVSVGEACLPIYIAHLQGCDVIRPLIGTEVGSFDI